MFTIIELFVSITMISLLVSILIPSLANARQMGKRAVCLSSQAHINSFSNVCYRRKLFSSFGAKNLEVAISGGMKYLDWNKNGFNAPLLK